MKIANMKLNCALILLNVFVIYSSAQCTSKLKEFNFATKEQPETVIMVEENCVEIVGLTQKNLKRFTNLKHYFEITQFSFDNVNTLNQPNLFVQHTNLKQIAFRTYNDLETIIVHEDLFGGLENLEDVTLSGLNLEIIPEKLFRHLNKLRKLNLSNNKLKSLHPNVFSTNPKLSYTFLGENQFLQSGIPLDLIFLNQRASVSFAASYVQDFNSLLPIFGHPNVTYTNLGFSNLTNVKLSDFSQFPERQNRMYMRIYDAEFGLYLANLKADGVEYEIISNTQIEGTVNTSRAFIETDVQPDSPLCNDCRFIKDVFKLYIRGKNLFNIYLTKSKVIFSVFLGCEEMENHYTNVYKNNCPETCSCKYNPLLHKVWISCNEQNLTDMPTIHYPSQFEKIKSIAIDLSKNSLESFMLANIDSRVTAHLSELNLSENQLKSVNFNESATLNIHQINLCSNPMWNETSDGVLIILNKGLHNVTVENCSLGQPYHPIILSETSNTTEQALDLILENGICN